MMSSEDKDKPIYDDQLLTRYLLGALPAEEAEPLDEWSIADEDAAARLSAVENDLVDAYVRGEIRGENLAQFESIYLSSAKRRQKVEFAQAMLRLEGRTAVAPAQDAPAIADPGSRPGREIFRWRMSPIRRLSLQWALSGAATVMLLVGAYLLFENLRLQKEMGEARARQSAFNRREQQLQKDLAEQRSANIKTQRELDQARAAQTDLDKLKTVSLLLMPPTRGTARVPSITLRPGTDLVVLLLTLESDDFPQYWAVLKDPATNQTLWSSTTLASTPAGEKKAVSISFRAAPLKGRNYVVELMGVPARGVPEIIGGYPFRVVLK